MLKVIIAIGLVFLVAALTVFGSPFFAVLLLIPAVLLYGVLTAASAGVEEETGDADAQPDTPAMQPDD